MINKRMIKCLAILLVIVSAILFYTYETYKSFERRDLTILTAIWRTWTNVSVAEHNTPSNYIHDWGVNVNTQTFVVQGCPTRGLFELRRPTSGRKFVITTNGIIVWVKPDGTVRVMNRD